MRPGVQDPVPALGIRQGDCIELPDAKTGGRVVPLGPETRAVLAALPRKDGTGDAGPVEHCDSGRG